MTATSTTRRQPRPTPAASRFRATVHARRPQPMPRGTTSVIWTRSMGTVVVYGEAR